MAASRKKTQRPARSVSQRSRKAVTRAAAIPHRQSLFTWTMVGFVGALVAAGIAAVIVESGAIENETTRELRFRVRSLANSKTARETLDWLNDRLAELRDEFNQQMAKIS